MLGTEWACVLAAPWPGGGSLLLRGDEAGVLALDLSPAPCVDPAGAEGVITCPALDTLRHYLAGGPWDFVDHPLPPGTLFQQRVWRALQLIAPGTLVTYGTLASRLGSSPRAVANACRANPLPLVVPCHRVVAAHGVGGYMGEITGEAVAIKRWLLRHEGYESADH